MSKLIDLMPELGNLDDFIGMTHELLALLVIEIRYTNALLDRIAGDVDRIEQKV